MSNELNLPKGEYVFREGENAQYAYILQEGVVEIVKTSVDGETTLAEITEKNTIFGEMALIDGAPRSAGAKARTDTLLTQVDKTAFLNYVSQNPQAAHNIMLKLSNELREANRTVSDLNSNVQIDDSDRSKDFIIDIKQSQLDIDDTDAIYDTPPSKPLMYAATIVLALFVAGFVFTSSTSVDTTVSTRGKFTTKVPNVDVQATSSAIIKRIVVERGQFLKKGQLVAILDETDAKSNLTSNIEQLAAVERRLLRIKYEQELIASGGAIPKESKLSTLLKDILKKRVEQYRAKIKSFSSRIVKLEQEIATANEEINSANETLAITKEQESLKRKIEEARKHLYDRKNGSLLSYLQARDATLAAKRARFDDRNLLASKMAALAAKKTDLSTLSADREEFTASWSSSLGESRSKDEDARIQLSQEAVKLKRDMTNVEVRAPVDGIVLDLPKVTSGSIVREGDVLLTLVRKNQPLTLEVDVTPKDISNVRLGAEVSVKLDALPFQEFGDIDGKLTYLSGDTYDDSLDGEKGSFYRGRVDISPSEISKLPSDFRLTPGMTASADMKVGKKRVITYLTHPILKGFSSAFSEPD